MRFAFWEWAQDRQVPVFIHPPRVPIGNEQQMDQFKLDELIGRPFDTAMALARMILSGLFDRYPRLKIVVAHMGGGLLPCMGRLDFGYRLGCEGMPEHSVIRCKQMPSDYLKLLHVDTMGFWAPHVREAVEVFGADRVMFGTDYGPVPIDPKEHVDIVNELAISPADKEKSCGATPRSFSIWTSEFRREERGSSFYSTVTLASLTTAAHFATSAGSMADISAGVFSATGNPWRAKLRAHRFLGQRRCDRAVKLVDHRRRRLRRRKQRRPGIGLDAGHAGLGERRHSVELRRALWRSRPRARGCCRMRSAARSARAAARCTDRRGRRAAR